MISGDLLIAQGHSLGDLDTNCSTKRVKMPNKHSNLRTESLVGVALSTSRIFSDPYWQKIQKGILFNDTPLPAVASMRHLFCGALYLGIVRILDRLSISSLSL
jgi:hypothetical protein